MNHTKRGLSTGAGSISQDEARNPSPGNLGLWPLSPWLVARYSINTGALQVNAGCRWGPVLGAIWVEGLVEGLGRRAFVWRSLGPNPLPVSNGRWPAKLRTLPPVSYPAIVDSRLDGTRLGSTRLETFRPQTRRAPLVFCLVARQSLASRRRRPDFDMSSFIFPRCCSGKKKRRSKTRQATKSPPRGSLPQLSLNQQGEAKGAHGPKDAGCVKTSYLGEEIRLRQRGQATPGIFQHVFSFFLFAIPATRATRSVGSAALPFFHSRLGGTVSLRQSVVAPTACRSDSDGPTVTDRLPP
ncbi:hypothetical protein EDB80DRAFT_727229 [Ilyonectria destructans]|nr:hypothetical protein EDB80DRAFT_727229 [Ilyonectria destructans]